MRADGDREDLTSDHPSAWTPSGGEEKDVDADEGDLSIDSRNVIGNSATSGIDVSVVEADDVTDDGDDQMRRARRPNLSIVQNDTGVDKTLTRVIMRETRKVSEIALVDWRKGVE